MWPCDLFNVVLSMVVSAFCEEGVDKELFEVPASVTMSTYFSELIREKVIEAIEQLKEWREEGTFEKKATAAVYDHFEPNKINGQGISPLPEFRIMEHLIGLGILHHWTTLKEDLTVYEESIEQLENVLTYGINKKSQEGAALEEKLTAMLEKFEL